jgi:N6-L-threonylcarbamoyladenine synthase
MINRPGYDFSFSGLKTAVMLKVREAEAAGTIDADRADIAASFQRATVETLIRRTLKAAKDQSATRVVVAGGVGANQLLRSELAARFDGTVYYPRMKFCTDNGAMIAVAGAMRLADSGAPGTIHARARWSLDTLAAPGSDA